MKVRIFNYSDWVKRKEKRAEPIGEFEIKEPTGKFKIVEKYFVYNSGLSR